MSAIDSVINPIQAWRKKHGLKRAQAIMVLALSSDGYAKQHAGVTPISAQSWRIMEMFDLMSEAERAILVQRVAGE